jgi:hypothetical protein
MRMSLDCNIGGWWIKVYIRVTPVPRILTWKRKSVAWWMAKERGEYQAVRDGGERKLVLSRTSAGKRCERDGRAQSLKRKAMVCLLSRHDVMRRVW